MKFIRPLLLLGLWVVTAANAQAENPLMRCEWNMDGVVREALVQIPPKAKAEAPPIVFAFHGHGGSMHNAARM